MHAYIHRLVIPPAIIIPLVLLSVKYGFMSQSHKLLQFLIIMESASPPAQMVIVSLSQIGADMLASRVAFTYVFVYMASIITVTFWASVGMYIIYE
jgi:hypothetical protein